MLGGPIVVEVGDERSEYCGKLLAWLGARVIRVEPMDGAPTRALAPHVYDDAGNLRSLHWESWNLNKQSLRLDLSSTDGQELMRRLLRRADVLLIGLDDPGAVGLSYAAVSQVSGDLVYVDITPFGRSGPYAAYRASDPVVFALGGYMYVSGAPEGPPMPAPGRQAYVVAGAHAAFSTLVSLRRRRRSGGGDRIEVSAFEALAAQENLYSTYSKTGTPIRRNGSQHNACAPGRIYPCADGYVHIFVGSQPGVWGRFVDWIGSPAELAGAQWENVAFRLKPENRTRIDALTTQFFATLTRDELVATAQERHIPASPVLRPAELAGDRHFVDRELITTVEAPGLGELPTVRPPWRSSEVASRLRPAPALGDDGAAVLKELLGVSDGTVSALRTQRVI